MRTRSGRAVLDEKWVDTDCFHRSPPGPALPLAAQQAGQTNTQDLKTDKRQLKQEEKADKAQAKADKKERKADSSKTAKQAAKAQDKANRQAEKVAPPSL